MGESFDHMTLEFAISFLNDFLKNKINLGIMRHPVKRIVFLKEVYYDTSLFTSTLDNSFAKMSTFIL